VRQLAAALSSCPNNVLVPISHIPHQPDDRSYDPFRSRKSGHRTYTGRLRRRIAALLHAVEKATAPGARPSSAASTRRPTLRPVSIMQMLRPNIHRLGAGKNARAPAGALEQTPTVGSAAVLGRINVTTDPTTCLDHANAAPEHSPAGGGQECPRSCTRWKKQRPRERGRPRPHQSGAPTSHQFRSSQSAAPTLTRWGCPNTVSVPMFTPDGFLRRLRQSPIGTKGNLRATPQSGGKTQTESLSPYPAPPKRSCCFDRLSCCQISMYRETDGTRGVRISANMKGFSI